MEEVLIYTTKVCPACEMAKKFFRERNVQYKEIDITDDEKLMEEAVRLSGQTGVPVIVINKEVLSGYRPITMEKLLSGAG